MTKEELQLKKSCDRRRATTEEEYVMEGEMRLKERHDGRNHDKRRVEQLKRSLRLIMGK